AEARLRLSQLLGDSSGAGFLIRSPSRLSPVDSVHGSGQQFAIVLPRISVTHNSGLPYSLDDGALWAGRGWNASVMAGFAVYTRQARLILVPTLLEEQNAPFQVIPYGHDLLPHRSQWANPFHPPPESIDLPLRFGDRARQLLDPGQSSLTVDAGAVSFGAATENLWWGPGIRNAITLSDNAAGVPHLFVQTRHPLRTAAGVFDAQLILGQLSQSAFFGDTSVSPNRSLSGIVATWAPPVDSQLTLGIARIVIASRKSGGFPLGAALDAFRDVGHPFTDTTSASPPSGRDQITSFFARWLLPSAGFEAYVEWARFEEPLSLRDLLEFPGHSEGYTLGFQWAHPLAVRRAFQLQGEATYLEPDPSLRLRPVATTYTSRDVVQGFTQGGQALGASIGPGSSSQWLAGDVFAPNWRIGGYLSRIRWDNGVLFEPIVPQFKRQDVTLVAGVRASTTWRQVHVLLDFAHGARFNYLFQAYVLGPNKTGGIDLVNNTLTLTLSAVPRVP
ncbi:MAG TPA: capsule assembly Wzi family protein, partial [Gemmatimonadaceae bacterium]|nr:capsule assembly Wzi family protein [Gemmatimonadaceae bacterium]